MKRNTLFLAGLLLAACSHAPKTGVDTIFVNAFAWTLEESAPIAEAIAVSGNEIVYVGDNEGALALAGKNTLQHDLTGNMLLPGFIDTHMHPVGGGAYAKALSLDTFGTVDDWLIAIEEYASENSDSPLIFGYGWLSTTFGPAGPQRQMIDSVVADRPVLIMDEGFHGAWANTRALEELNITRDTADPTPGFSYYKRDESGDATGYLLEGTAGMAMQSLNVITEDVVVDGTAHVIDTLNGYGVTSAFDAGALGYEEDLQQVLDRLEDAGDLTIRLLGSYRPTGPDDVDVAVERAGEWRDTIKGDNYHYRFLKIMQDGTVEGRTAAMFEDYQGEPGNSGESIYSEEEMTKMVAGATGENIDVHIHALGERAVHEALNAIEVARNKHPDSSTRYAVCHIQVIADQDLPRFAELDVIAQSTPLWASYDTFGEQFVSEDQFQRFWRFNSLKKLARRPPDMGQRLSGQWRRNARHVSNRADGNRPYPPESGRARCPDPAAGIGTSGPGISAPRLHHRCRIPATHGRPDRITCRGQAGRPGRAGPKPVRNRPL
jgi:predicted amidohydrolase YtcJ